MLKLEKSTITIFGISAVILLLILKYVVLEPPIRHTRICEESRLLAAISERQKLFPLAKSLYDRALREAEELSSEDFRVAITFDDLALLHMRLKRYEIADAELVTASRILQGLLKKTSGLKRDLVISERIRAELLNARCRLHFHDLREAREAFLYTIRIQNMFRPELHSVDLASLMRVKEAFCSYCQISVRTNHEADAVTTLVSAMQPSGIPQQMPSYAKEEMRNAFADLMFATAIPKSAQNIELSKFLEQLNADSSTSPAKKQKPNGTAK